MMIKISLAGSDIGAHARARQPHSSENFDDAIRWPTANVLATGPARPSPGPREWWRPIAKAASLAMAHLVESLAFYALATHPDQSWRWADDEVVNVEDRAENCLVLPYRQPVAASEPSLESAAIARPAPAPSRIGSGKWLISTPVALWSRLRRAGDSRRMRAAWDRVDDRTLSDIGVSRYEIERITGFWPY